MIQLNDKFIKTLIIIFFMLLFTVTTRHTLVLGIQKILDNIDSNTVINRIFIYFVLASICALTLWNLGSIDLVLPKKDKSRTFQEKMKYIVTFLVFLLYGVSSWNTIDQLIHMFIQKTNYNKLPVYGIISVASLYYIVASGELHLILG